MTALCTATLPHESRWTAPLLAVLSELQPRFIAESFPLRYSIHLWDLKHPGTWESKGTYVYYTDFAMELAMLFLDLIHHIHMLVRHRRDGSCRLKVLFLFNCFPFTWHLFIRVLVTNPPQLFGNIWLSMASLVIFMQLRYLFHEVQRRLRRHKNYLRVINNMEAR